MVQRRERKFPALREFEVSGVVRREPVALRQLRGGRPRLVGGLRIQLDWRRFNLSTSQHLT
jgi:hypothetical protein